MDDEDTAKNGVSKNTIPTDGGLATIKIRIPALNEYPIKDIKHWAKQVYHQARIKLHWRKADKFKEMMPIETAAYAVRKVFGNWRLVAPSADNEISPLQQVIEWLQPYIVPTCPVRSKSPDVHRGTAVPVPHGSDGLRTPMDIGTSEMVATKTSRERTSNGARWGEFRRDFIYEIKLDFNAICDSDYDPAMVAEVNGRLNELLGKFARTTPRPPLLRGNNGENPPLLRGDWGREESPLEKGDNETTVESRPKREGGCVRINFVLEPETAEFYSSPRLLGIRSRIWERFTGKGLDLSMYQNPAAAGRRMAMYLELAKSVEHRA